MSNIAAYTRIVQAAWNHEIHSVVGVRLRNDAQSEMHATKIHRKSDGFRWELDTSALILKVFFPIEFQSIK